jgi:hypothetical protein
MKMKLNADNLQDAQQEIEEFASTLVKRLPVASVELGEWSDDGLTNTLRIVIRKDSDEQG